MTTPSSSQFIPARESPWFIHLFAFYTRILFSTRFKHIYIDQYYRPDAERKTIYYLNHTSWWDGLIPLLLNRKRLKQNARAMMEDTQMMQYRLFSKIGAFSVNLKNPRSTLVSLRYAVDSMERKNASLFIYPEGKIVPFSTQKPDFKKGLGWISNQCPEADVVPIGIYILTARYSKPELFIRVGKKIAADHSLDSETLNEIFETEMQKLLHSLCRDSHKNPGLFDKL